MAVVVLGESSMACRLRGVGGGVPQEVREIDQSRRRCGIKCPAAVLENHHSESCCCRWWCVHQVLQHVGPRLRFTRRRTSIMGCPIVTLTPYIIITLDTNTLDVERRRGRVDLVQRPQDARMRFDAQWL
jgi:hypothetical protein